MYDNLLDAIIQKVPKKAELVKIVTDTLRIEKESAYRRLRGEIPFTLNEAGVIASSMGISMDELIYMNNKTRANLAYMTLPLHTSQEDYDYESFRQLVGIFKEISSNQDSEHGMAVNTPPAVAYLHLKHLTNFLLFKWSHHYGDPGIYMRYKDTHLTEEGVRLQQELRTYMHNIDRTICVTDISIVENVLQDLRYYINVRLINPEEADSVLGDLMTLMDDMQYIAQHGRFRDTGNRFEIYLSEINIATSYNYAVGGRTHVSSLTTFVFQSALSIQKEAYLKIRDWVHYLQRMSTSVTVVGAKERINFIDRQRRRIEELRKEYSAVPELS